MSIIARLITCQLLFLICVNLGLPFRVRQSVYLHTETVFHWVAC